MWFFSILICTTIVISPITTAPSAKHEEYSMKPDMEEFITQLLKSEKFEQLADKIAARAADKIISMQHLQQYDRARDNATPKLKSDMKNIDSESNEQTAHKSLEDYEENKKKSHKSKSASNNHKKLLEKPKIDTIAAIKKISKFPVVDLSLNFKHFTNRDKVISKTKTSDEKDESSEDENKTTHSKKKTKKNNDDYGVYVRAADSETESGSWADSGVEYVDNESYDESIGDTNDQKSSESREKKVIRKSEKMGHKQIERESNENKETKEIYRNKKSRISESIEAQDYSVTKEPKDKTRIKGKINAPLNTEDKIMVKNNPPVNDINTSFSPPLKDHFMTTTSFENGDLENVQENEQNIVSDNVDEATLDSKTIQPKMQKDVQKISKSDGEKINENNKNKPNEKDDAIKIDTEHKVRENKGKLYAFAQSPDYEEYHEEVANLLKSVKNNDMNQNNVNQDLIDLMN